MTQPTDEAAVEPSDDAYRVVESSALAWNAALSESDGDRAAALIIQAYGDKRVTSERLRIDEIEAAAELRGRQQMVHSERAAESAAQAWKARAEQAERMLAEADKSLADGIDKAAKAPSGLRIAILAQTIATTRRFFTSIRSAASGEQG